MLQKQHLKDQFKKLQNLIGNKIADEITSIAKPKEREKTKNI